MYMEELGHCITLASTSIDVYMVKTVSLSDLLSFIDPVQPFNSTDPFPSYWYTLDQYPGPQSAHRLMHKRLVILTACLFGLRAAFILWASRLTEQALLLLFEPSECSFTNSLSKSPPNKRVSEEKQFLRTSLNVFAGTESNANHNTHLILQVFFFNKLVFLLQ